MEWRIKRWLVEPTIPPRTPFTSTRPSPGCGQKGQDHRTVQTCKNARPPRLKETQAMTETSIIWLRHTKSIAPSISTVLYLPTRHVQPTNLTQRRIHHCGSQYSKPTPLHLYSLWCHLLRNYHSRVGTSHWSSELILTFLDSGGSGEWGKKGANWKSNFFFAPPQWIDIFIY